jgi:hypothetical protein
VGDSRHRGFEKGEFVRVVAKPFCGGLSSTRQREPCCVGMCCVQPHNPAELEELMRPPKVDDGTLGTAITQLPRAAKALESTQR